ncbi:MAG: type II toxin-antitoxin system RelE/ParE family toxin [Candidatus Competibacteraceae bacterium]
MQLLFRPEAEEELLEAQAWYEARSPGLGLEFARAADAAVAAALRNPLIFPCIEGEFRRVILRKFPYTLIYLPGDEYLLVVACFHHRRKPGEWLERVIS